MPAPRPKSIDARPLLTVLSWGALLAVSDVARAGSLFELTGASTSANSWNARVFERGSANTFFNPGHLGRVRQSTEVGVSFLVTHADVELDDRPAGVDVPEEIYRARAPEVEGAPPLRPLPTIDLAEARADTAVRDALPYVTIGVVQRLVAESLVFGFYGVLPLQSFHRQDSFFVDEREQYFSNQLHFELLGDRAELASFAVALGGQAFEWLGIGAGVDITIGTRAVTYGYVPDGSDQRTVLLNPDITVESVFAPHAGVVVAPTEALDITATVHAPVSSEVDGENRLRFFNFNYPDERGFVLQTYQSSLGYTPLRASVGVSFVSPDRATLPEWEVGAHALYARWSDYRDRQGERPLDAWSDTVSAAIGGAFAVEDRRVSADLAFVPSPVPDQTGRTNYVDNARLLGSLGYEAPLTAFGVPVRLGFHLQGQWMVPRHVEKRASTDNPVRDEVPDGAENALTGEPIPGAAGLQTNNPGYPGFSSSGFLVGAGLSLRVPDTK